MGNALCICFEQVVCRWENEETIFRNQIVSHGQFEKSEWSGLAWIVLKRIPYRERYVISPVYLLH